MGMSFEGQEVGMWPALGAVGEREEDPTRPRGAVRSFAV